jgi:TPR repeat protein
MAAANADARGNLRGHCTECGVDECEQFIAPTTKGQFACAFCGCPPTKHEKLETEGETDQPPLPPQERQEPGEKTEEEPETPPRRLCGECHVDIAGEGVHAVSCAQRGASLSARAGVPGACGECGVVSGHLSTCSRFGGSGEPHVSCRRICLSNSGSASGYGNLLGFEFGDIVVELDQGSPPPSGLRFGRNERTQKHGEFEPLSCVRCPLSSTGAISQVDRLRQSGNLVSFRKLLVILARCEFGIRVAVLPSGASEVDFVPGDLLEVTGGISPEPESVRVVNIRTSSEGVAKLANIAELIAPLATGMDLTTVRYRLASAYLHGDGGSRDYDQADSLFRGLVESGHTQSMSLLGWMRYKGTPTADFAEAVRLCEMSGIDDSLDTVGRCYRKGGPGISQDHAKAFEAFSRAADSGCEESRNFVGKYYRDGLDGIEPDMQQAVKAWMVSRTGGALLHIGEYLRDEESAGDDYEVAAFVSTVLFLLASAEGHPKADACLEAVPDDVLTRAKKFMGRHQDEQSEVEDVLRDLPALGFFDPQEALGPSPSGTGSIHVPLDGSEGDASGKTAGSWSAWGKSVGKAAGDWGEAAGEAAANWGGEPDVDREPEPEPEPEDEDTSSGGAFYQDVNPLQPGSSFSTNFNTDYFTPSEQNAEGGLVDETTSCSECGNDEGHRSYCSYWASPDCPQCGAQGWHKSSCPNRRSTASKTEVETPQSAPSAVDACDSCGAVGYHKSTCPNRRTAEGGTVHGWNISNSSGKIEETKSTGCADCGAVGFHKTTCPQRKQTGKGHGHNFKTHSFKKPTNCEVCGNMLFGLVKQGKQCKKCGFVCHKKTRCLANAPKCSQWFRD